MVETPDNMSAWHPKYPKIQSIFKRDPKTKYKTFLEWEFSTPEFEMLQDIEWLWMEQLDGTNMRVGYFPAADGFISIGGRTDKAQIQDPLHQWITERITAEKMRDVFGENRIVTLYGEGVGSGIQKDGFQYGDQHLVLFDVLVDDGSGGIWLEQDSVKDVAEKLGIPVAPFSFYCSIADMVDFVKHRPGYESDYVTARTPDFASRTEGYVGRPIITLLDRMGQRIITKIKMKDYHPGEYSG